MQMWTITSLDGSAVIAPVVITADESVSPKAGGFPWDAATMRAWRLTARPPEGSVFVAGTWVADLAVLRAARWKAVRAAREQAQEAGCASPLGRVDTDPASQLKIAGAVQMAMVAQAAGQPFAIDWTMQDNGNVIHDAVQMIAMGLAVGQHIAACHEVALTRRAAIEAAQDEAAIAAVEVDDGWPA
ncbi:DUF4376 domain-containing protein [Sphingomonas endophytica]|uniref:DUF4376 domain-containing protein n=1 Tax=Sphingomonas endophytica TaxID=869719 RepID=A0A147I3E1_9SPHN|nr:DUF4376 domain-containing protein [Sphingomonas endophytica]KTT72611.1 hypothetical protein NS334_08430 [Sphingomonas endophytica]